MTAPPDPAESPLATQVLVERFAGHVRRPVHHDWTAWRRFPYPVIVHVYSGEFQTEIEGEPDVITAAGATLLVPAYLRNRVRSQDGCELVFTHTRFRFGALDAWDRIDLPRDVAGPASAGIGEALERFEVAHRGAEGENDSVAGVTRRQLRGLELLLAVIAAGRTRSGAPARPAWHPAISAVLQLIDASLARRLHRAELARAAGLSEARLTVVFRRALGCAPMAWVETRRLEQAQALLLTTELSVLEIAQRVGFTDPFHFSRRFRARFGLAPSSWRTRQVRAPDLP